MNFKLVFAIIAIGIFIGTGVFMWSGKKQTNQVSSPVPKTTNQSIKSIPSPSPLPSLPPIDRKTDLQKEMSTLEVPDFTPEYDALKTEVMNNF